MIKGEEYYNVSCDDAVDTSSDTKYNLLLKYDHIKNTAKSRFIIQSQGKR